MGLTSLNMSAPANDGAVLHLLHPIKRTPLFAGEGDEKAPVTITLLGKDSDAFIEAERSLRNRGIENSRKGAKFSADEQDANGAKLLAVCTVSWRGIPKGWLDGTDDETPVECNRANAEKLYTQTGVRWVLEQVDEFVADRANFSTASSGS